LGIRGRSAVVDDCSKESVQIVADTSIPALYVTRVFAALVRVLDANNGVREKHLAAMTIPLGLDVAAVRWSRFSLPPPPTSSSSPAACTITTRACARTNCSPS
jgi:hypothetical protein